MMTAFISIDDVRKLSDEQLDKRVAFLCGWREAFPKNEEPHPETKRGGVLLPYRWVNEDTHERDMFLPAYSGDMNAVQGAEEGLTNNQRISRNIWLWRLTVPGKEKTPWDMPKSNIELGYMIDATPRQRTEALLLTLEKI